MTDSDRTNMRKTTVGFVFQKYNLLPTLTARDNIEIARNIAGKTGPMDPEFEKLLTLLGLTQRLTHRPRAMSGGEQQRVAIARAIVNHPAILLADEPTGNLDTENSNAVLGLMRNLNKELGQTILMITHNPEAAAFADRIVTMRDGRIRFLGVNVLFPAGQRIRSVITRASSVSDPEVKTREKFSLACLSTIKLLYRYKVL